MLGHSHLSTTDIYTHVAIHKLKGIHTLTHSTKVKNGDKTLSMELSEANVMAMLVAEEMEGAGEID